MMLSFSGAQSCKCPYEVNQKAATRVPGKLPAFFSEFAFDKPKGGGQVRNVSQKKVESSQFVPES